MRGPLAHPCHCPWLGSSVDSVLFLCGVLEAARMFGGRMGAGGLSHTEAQIL